MADALAGNLGRWAPWYDALDEPEPYGDTSTYRIAADHLADCATVEDWGCGKGWLRTLIPPERYRGIDGTDSPFCDYVADLADYRSIVEGVVLRHVLEHDYRWERILANAVASATRKLVVVVFTPLAETTTEIGFTDELGVPDLAFAESDITRHLDGLVWSMLQIATETEYGGETVFLVG